MVPQQPPHLVNGHVPLRHTTSYDESYAAATNNNILHPSHVSQSAAVSQQQMMTSPAAGQLYDNAEYYAHCHEQKYKPPPQHLDMCKFAEKTFVCVSERS